MATAPSRPDLSRAYGGSTVTTRSPTGSRAGSAPASRAWSTPYLAMSSAALAVNASASAGVHAGSSALASSLRTRASSGLSLIRGLPHAARWRSVATVEPARASRQSGSWPSAMAAPNRASPVGMSPFTYALTNRATQRLSYRASSIPGKSSVQAPPRGRFCPTIVAARHQATSYAPTTPDRSTTASKVPTTASLSPLSAQCNTCVASSRACCGMSVTWEKVRGYVKNRRSGAPKEAGEAGRAHPVAVLVGDDDLVGHRRPAPVHRRRHPGDGPRADALVVRRVDVHADRERPVHGDAVQHRPDRADRLREHARRPAVQQAVRLGVALDRHGGDHPLGRRLGDLDAHALTQGTGTPAAEELPHAVRRCRHVGQRYRRVRAEPATSVTTVASTSAAAAGAGSLRSESVSSRDGAVLALRWSDPLRRIT